MRALSAVKRRLSERFPHWIAAYHDVRTARELRSRPAIETPLGFRFAGHEGMEAGTFEPAETAFLTRQLVDADVFVDVGANAGYFTCIARQMQRHVVAVEPLHHNLERLYANIRMNGWEDVEVFPLGLGAESGLRTLFGGGTAASLVPGWAGTNRAWCRTVAFSTLDRILAHRFPSKRLIIKIDVEGGEYDVAAGANSTLERDPAPVWLVEVCFRENFGNGVNPHFRDLFQTFWEKGYSATSLETNGRPVVPDDVERWLATGVRDFGYVSYVFERRAAPAIGRVQL